MKREREKEEKMKIRRKEHGVKGVHERKGDEASTKSRGRRGLLQSALEGWGIFLRKVDSQERREKVSHYFLYACDAELELVQSHAQNGKSIQALYI